MTLDVQFAAPSAFVVEFGTDADLAAGRTRQDPTMHLRSNPFLRREFRKDAARRAAAKPYLQIVEWAAADIDPDPQQLGLQGSPTKVKKIENVVFQAKEAKKLTAADEDINSLMVELIASHTLG